MCGHQSKLWIDVRWELIPRRGCGAVNDVPRVRKKSMKREAHDVVGVGGDECLLPAFDTLRLPRELHRTQVGEVLQVFSLAPPSRRCSHV